MQGIEKRILVVDDDIDFLMLLERRLLMEGYVVETAASIPEAQDIIPTFSPNLLLLDINIRGEDGRQLCYQLKTTRSAIRVILLSGYDHSLTRAVLFGADDLLPKPINYEFLVHRVEHWLRHTLPFRVKE